MERDREGRNEAEREERDGTGWRKTVPDSMERDRQGRSAIERNGTGHIEMERDREERNRVERNGTGQRGPERGGGIERNREGRNKAEREKRDGTRRYGTVWNELE